MGWTGIDIFLVYFFKCAIRVFYFFESFSWERTEAKVTGRVVLNPDWGCSSVRLHYRFISNGHSIKSQDVIPFCMLWHSKTYAESFTHNLPRTIRVSPKNPQETRFFERDQ
jgi:hypothetical protein